MKKIISALTILTILSSNSDAAEICKNKPLTPEDTITIGHFVGKFMFDESFPPLAINNLTIENPEILPQIMLTCKKFNSRTQEL